MTWLKEMLLIVFTTIHGAPDTSATGGSTTRAFDGPTAVNHIHGSKCNRF